MTQKSWPWTTVAGVGDGAAQLNEALSREFLAVYFGVQNPAVEGVSKGVGGELAVSGVATPLAVASGSAICYGLYINDAAVNTPAISTPAVGTTGGRVVLQTNWAGTGGGSLEARTRVAVIKSADGVAAIPALTQVFGTTWEISLATFQITTGGAITVTDDRTFRKSTMVVASGGLDVNIVGDTILRDSAGVSVIGRSANSVGDPADIVAGADDRLLARTGGVVGFVQATIGMIPDALITLAKLANLAGVSLLGRAANSSGVMAAITAAANDRVLARTGDALSFVQLTAGMVPNSLIANAMLAADSVTTAKIADSQVTAAKIANRTRTVFIPVSGAYNGTDGVGLQVFQLGPSFPDNKDCEAYGQWQVPQDYVSGLTIDCVVLHQIAGPRNVYAGAFHYSGKLTEDQDANSDSFAVAAISVTGNTLTAIARVTPAAPEIGDIFQLKGFRTGSNVLDTVGNVVSFLGWIATYTADS